MNRKWQEQAEAKSLRNVAIIIGGGMCAYALIASLWHSVEPKPANAENGHVTLVKDSEPLEVVLGNTHCYLQKVRIDGTSYFLSTSNCTLTYNGWR